MALITNPIEPYRVGTQPSQDEGMKEYLKRELQKVSITLDSMKRAVEELETAVEGYHP